MYKFTGLGLQHLGKNKIAISFDKNVFMYLAI